VNEGVAGCTEVHPELRALAPGHDVRCFRYHDPDGRPLRGPDEEAVR
jgi:hypothetical protein